MRSAEDSVAEFIDGYNYNNAVRFHKSLVYEALMQHGRVSSHGWQTFMEKTSDLAHGLY